MLKRALRRFNAQNDGSAAVEFAFIAPPFFMLLFAVFETAMVFFASSNLENGVHEAARLVRTGQIQSSGGGIAEFRQVVCDNAPLLASCDSDILIDVRKFQDFTNVSFNNPVVNGEIQNNFNFTPGTAGEVVLVRVFYVWDVNVPFIGTFLSNMNGGKRLLSSAIAFRNEPF